MYNSTHPLYGDAGTLQYPVNLDDTSSSKVIFQLVKVEPPAFHADFRKIGKIATSLTEADRDSNKLSFGDDVKAQAMKRHEPPGRRVELYMPQGVSITDVFQYDNVDLGIGAAALANAINSGGSVNDAMNNALEAGFQGISNIVKMFSGSQIGGLGVLRAAQAAPFVSNAVRSAVSVSARRSVHPNTRTTFNKPGIRKFTYQFKFIATSPEEAKSVNDIISFFRFHAYPHTIDIQIDGTDYRTPVGYEYPDMFKIIVQTKIQKGDKTAFVDYDNIKLLDCFIEGITTNYNPTAAIFHPDGEPVEIDFSINFVEHRAFSRNDIPGAPEATLHKSDVKYKSHAGYGEVP